jgi:hypothetical protein
MKRTLGRAATHGRDPAGRMRFGGRADYEDDLEDDEEDEEDQPRRRRRPKGPRSAVGGQAPAARADRSRRGVIRADETNRVGWGPFSLAARPDSEIYDHPEDDDQHVMRGDVEPEEGADHPEPDRDEGPVHVMHIHHHVHTGPSHFHHHGRRKEE